MTAFTKRISLSVLSITLSLGGGFFLAVRAQSTTAQPQAVVAGPQAVATADQLKSKAFEALRAGKFGLTNDYLSQAATLSKDPVLVRMAAWTKQFEQQRQVFASERKKEYDQAVADVHKLLDRQMETFAIEAAAKAYVLAEDKDAFRKEPWLVKLLADARTLATDYENKQQWIKALRIYSQLTAIEPAVPEWKEKLKTTTRRARLLALYTPDELKHIQEADAKEREAVEALLHPTTKPTTKPTEDENEAQSRIDWRDALRDVRMDMLKDAIRNAHSNYFRTVTYKKMLTGGLSSLRVVLTTPALEKAFPGLADGAKRSQFLGIIDANIGKIDKSRSDDSDLMSDLLDTLQAANASTVKLPERVLVAEFADGAFGALDPFSSIIWPSDWDEFQKTTKGEFSGVGIQIQSDEAGNLKVVSPLEDSPAYKAGIKPESIITHINGKSAKWISVNQAVKLITGQPGTKVTLTIKGPKGDVHDYTLERNTIKVASVKGWLHLPRGGWEYFVDPEQKIGYMRVTNFTKTTADDMKAAISQMEDNGARGIIMDLRYNPGGLLNSATEVVDQFIPEGLIVSTRPDRPDSSQENSTYAHNRNEVKMPLVVLVNQYSASASEIVSGALKDHKRALIVGERTFGKGSVQMLYPLGSKQPPECVLKLTTSHYYLPNGKCIHREENSKEWGVEPDVTVEMTPEQMRAAIDARQEFDILRDSDPTQSDPAAQKLQKIEEKGEKGEKAEKAKKDPLASDPQLAAGLLLMRLKLAGAQL